ATITDKDGDSSSAVINVAPALSFKDDGPTISATAAADALTVDETSLTTNALANFADNFSSNFGADAAGNITYALGVVANTGTNLVDTATNEAVKLVSNSGVIEGRTVTTNALVFVVA